MLLNLQESTVKRFLKKSKDDKIYEDGYIIQKGEEFAVFRKYENDFVILQMNTYHNLNYWINLLREIAEKWNCKYFVFATKRNPKAFAKLTNAKIDAYILRGEV